MRVELYRTVRVIVQGETMYEPHNVGAIQPLPLIELEIANPRLATPHSGNNKHSTLA